MAQESRKREKEETGCQLPEGLKLCINNCGFFGSPATMNLCSNCYNDLLRLNTSMPSIVQQQPGVSIPRPGVSGAPEFRPEERPCLEVVGGPSATGAAKPETPQRQTNRCTGCRKRVGLTGFKCRCGDLFCALHRYSDRHNCTFDYKAAGRAAIAKANPVVKADKIQRL